MSEATQPPGWYPAQGDPPGTVRWWDGEKWVGGPQTQGQQQQAGYVAPGAGTLAIGRELADPWLRIAAGVIDFIISAVIALIFGAGTIVAAFQGDGAALTGTQFVLAFLGSIVTAAYFVVMNSMFSATIGKMALGLRIVQRDGTEPLGWPVGIKRTANRILGIAGNIPILGFIVSLALIVMNIVSLVFLFSDPEHRTVMDRFADTYVVKK